MKRQNISISLDEKTIKALAFYIKDTNQTRSRAIENIIREHLKQELDNLTKLAD